MLNEKRRRVYINGFLQPILNIMLPAEMRGRFTGVHYLRMKKPLSPCSFSCFSLLTVLKWADANFDQNLITLIKYKV